MAKEGIQEAVDEALSKAREISGWVLALKPSIERAVTEAAELYYRYTEDQGEPKDLPVESIIAIIALIGYL